MARVRPVHFVLMYLILSTTRIVVLGQKAAFANIGEDGSPVLDGGAPAPALETETEEEQANQQQALSQEDQNIATFLSSLGLFGGDGFPSQGAADGMTTSDDTENRSSGGSTFSSDGSALNEDISFLLRMANESGMPPEVTSAIQNSLRQQQSVGGLRGIESAASTVANFLRLPSTVGSGQNLKLFADRLQAMQDLRNRVSGLLRFDQLRTIDGYLLTAQELALGWVAAFPLAQLAFIISLIALAAAILGLLGGIFYIVASSLALAGAIGAASQNRDSSIESQEWYARLRESAGSLSDKIIPLAFSEQGTAPIHTAIAVLELTDQSLAALLPDQGDASSEDGQNQGPFQDIGGIFSNLAGGPGEGNSLLDSLQNAGGLGGAGGIADLFQDFELFGEETNRKA